MLPVGQPAIEKGYPQHRYKLLMYYLSVIPQHMYNDSAKVLTLSAYQIFLSAPHAQYSPHGVISQYISEKDKPDKTTVRSCVMLQPRSVAITFTPRDHTPKISLDDTLHGFIDGCRDNTKQ